MSALPSSLEEVRALIDARGRSAPRTAVLIRLRLLEGPASCYELYRWLREVHAALGLRPPSYERVRQMLFVLRRLNLVRVAGTREASRPWLIPESVYELVPEQAGSQLWLNPKAHYAPSGGRAAARRERRGGRRAARMPATVEECEGVEPGMLVELALAGRRLLDGVVRLLELRRGGCSSAEMAWGLLRDRLEADRALLDRLAGELVEEGVLAEGVEYDAGFLLWLIETAL